MKEKSCRTAFLRMTLHSLSMIQTAFKTCVAPSVNHACAGLLVFLCISSTCAAAWHFFPTCQVRVVRFYVTLLLLLLLFLVLLPSSPRLLLRIESEHPRPVFPRISTASSHRQCSLPDLNRKQPRTATRTSQCFLQLFFFAVCCLRATKVADGGLQSAK